MENNEKNTEKKEFKLKKPKMKYVVLIIIGLIIVGCVLAAYISAYSPVKLECINPENGDIEKLITSSGNIAACDEKTYFAVGGAKLSSVGVEAGDYVEAGTVLFSYDEEDIKLAVSEAQLNMTKASGDYADAIETNDKTTLDYLVDQKGEEIVWQQKVDTQNAINDLKEKIKERKKKINKDNALLQDLLADEDLDPESEKAKRYQKEYNNNTAKLTSDTDIVKWTEELEKQEKLLAQYEDDYKTYETEKKAKEDAILTEGKKQSIAAEQSLVKLKNNDVVARLSANKGGVKAESNGIVTEVKGVEGSIPEAGAQILTIVSTEALKVDINLSKSDIEYVKEGQKVDVTFLGNTYEGKVAKINKMASKNESGAIVIGAEISIDGDNDDFIIGSEAKVKIHVGEAKNVMTVPNLVINYDTDGAFVYVISDGVIVKKSVEIGLSNDESTEIVKGLTKQDVIVNQANDTFKEGDAAEAVFE